MSLHSNVNLPSMRVDLVGSLLRPQSVKAAFVAFGEGKITEAQLKETLDQAIREVVAKQVGAQFADRCGWRISPNQLHGKFFRRWPEWRNGRLELKLITSS